MYIPYLDYFLSLVQYVYAHNKSVNVLHYEILKVYCLLLKFIYLEKKSDSFYLL
jgi:hypothetical protein